MTGQEKTWWPPILPVIYYKGPEAKSYDKEGDAFWYDLGILPELWIPWEKNLYKHRKLMIELKLSFDGCLPCLYICSEVLKYE